MSGVGHSMRNCAVVALLVLNSFSLFAADNLKLIEIQMSRDVKLEFQPCPAGTYTMGKENDTKEGSCTKSHKVTITRPFWMGKYKITHAQWNRISEPVRDVYRGKNTGKGKKKDKNRSALSSIPFEKIPVSKVQYWAVVDYCKHLNRRYKAKLPKGYVLRLPTEAEWEYALKANASDFSDPYVMYLQGSYAEKKEAEESIMVQDEDFEKWLSGFEALTEDDRKWAKEILLCPVGTKKPNQWGLYDMLSNGAEMTLDTLWEDAALHRYYTHDIKDEIKYAEEEVDPLRMGELDERFKPKGGNRINSIIRGSQLQEKRFVGDVNFKKFYPCDIKNNLLPSVSFRLCIGPDLVNEKKAERAKK